MNERALTICYRCVLSSYQSDKCSLGFVRVCRVGLLNATCCRIDLIGYKHSFWCLFTRTSDCFCRFGLTSFVLLVLRSFTLQFVVVTWCSLRCLFVSLQVRLCSCLFVVVFVIHILTFFDVRTPLCLFVHFIVVYAIVHVTNMCMFVKLWNIVFVTQRRDHSNLNV